AGVSRSPAQRGFRAPEHAPDPLAPPTCSDGIKNEGETDVDCGGIACAPCASGHACATAGDCTSGVCDGMMCAWPRCRDGVRNGSESDVDCGGGCAPCEDRKSCGQPGDCQSGVCAVSLCVAATCADAVANGDETDLDCG